MNTVDIIKVVFMAIVQGIGEFLPISSSGHLLVVGKLLFSGSGGIDEDEQLTLAILLHAGTLLSILVIFRRSIWEMLTANLRLIFLLIIGTIPTGIIGVGVKLVAKKFCPGLTSSLSLTGIGFLITGFLLLNFLGKKNRTKMGPSGSRVEEAGQIQNDQPMNGQSGFTNCPLKSLRTMTWIDALIIGIFQGVATLPGISRSGATIVGGILRKLNPEDSAVFSFLLAIPAIAGATVLEMFDFVREKGESFVDSNFNLYLGGAIISFIIGLISLAYLMKWLKEGKLSWFAWWLFFIGSVSIIWGICS